MFEALCKINHKPKPYEFYTASRLWADEHTSQKMLEYHLNEDIDVSSRNINFINKSINWIQEHFNLSPKSTILDLGCGPGLYSNRLAKLGANVTAIDFSIRSINYARNRANEMNLQINFLNQNYLQFETSDSYDLILMIYCDYCALSPEQRKSLLRKFLKILKPNGRILLDVYSLKNFELKKEMASYEKNFMNNFWSADDNFCFINKFKYDKEKVSLEKYSIYSHKKTEVVYNWLQHFSRESIKVEFEKNGLKITDFLGDVCGNPFDKNLTEFSIIAELI